MPFRRSSDVSDVSLVFLWLPATLLVPSCGPNFAMSNFSVFCLGNSVP